jgi:hypothetical protein
MLSLLQRNVHKRRVLTNRALLPRAPSAARSGAPAANGNGNAAPKPPAAVPAGDGFKPVKKNRRKA